MTSTSWRARLPGLVLLAVVLAGCTTRTDEGQPTPVSPSTATPSGTAETQESVTKEEADRSDAFTFVIPNQGGDMEGHTPRGFQGMGTGLFVGDNLSPRFPNGDGVQLFFTFDLSGIPAGDVLFAVLRSVNAQVRGTPFHDLGSLNVEEFRYDRFSQALWNSQAISEGASCVFGTRAGETFDCDLGEAVQRSLDDAYPFAQFRLRLDRAGDGDGIPDMVLFFITDSNTNQPGIFELEVTMSKS